MLHVPGLTRAVYAHILAHKLKLASRVQPPAWSTHASACGRDCLNRNCHATRLAMRVRSAVCSPMPAAQADGCKKLGDEDDSGFIIDDDEDERGMAGRSDALHRHSALADPNATIDEVFTESDDNFKPVAHVPVDAQTTNNNFDKKSKNLLQRFLSILTGPGQLSPVAQLPVNARVDPGQLSLVAQLPVNARTGPGQLSP
eukprot:103131-Chlamydomonas_euryale.AAC.1